MNSEDKRGLKLAYDGDITISIGKNPKEINWKNVTAKWSELLKRLSSTIYTSETMAEYKTLPKGDKDKIKDVGGFVGGELKEGKRKNSNVVKRSILTLDAGFVKEGLWDTIEMLFDFACCIYSTHKHSLDTQRYTVVIPLSRTVTEDEYGAIARRVAGDIGIDYFDDTTYETSRFMYWPSTSKDGIFQFNFQDGEWLNPDEVLNRYENWKDVSLWPASSRVKDKRKSLTKEKVAYMEDLKEADIQWMKLLERNKEGTFRSTIGNVVLILENDHYLKGKIALNEFSYRTTIRGDLPWHRVKNKVEGDPWKDSDDAALRHYIERVYGINSPLKISDGLAIVEEKNKYHPVREYLSSLVWDGEPRVEELFIDYLGAEDNVYVRAVTRKALVAAVARIFIPGIKFDYMVVLVGGQGIGKSYIINLLGQNWYSDSLNTVQGKESYEQLQDAWIIEMAELSATKKAEAEAVKHFISKREDIYRVAYGKRVTKFPRQCVFFGTTNDREFLRDKTGNRRFWPVAVGGFQKKKTLWRDMNKDEIGQIWAEALSLWNNGESLYLDEKMEKEAIRKQEQYTEESSKEGLIREYLNISLPNNWNDLDTATRRNLIHGVGLQSTLEGNVQREKVCAMEVWVELFQGDPKMLTPMQAREINDILRKIEEWEPYSSGTGKLRFGKSYGVQRAFVRIGAKITY